MDTDALKLAVVSCLANHDTRFTNAELTKTVAIPGGYSRLTFCYSFKFTSGEESHVVLQYVPKGDTGIVRVDRNLENAILSYLTDQSEILASELIVADLDGQFFDSAAFIFKAISGGSFLEQIRAKTEADYPDLNKMVARSAGSVHSMDIQTLPSLIERPSSWSDYIDGQIQMFRDADSESKNARPFLRYMASWLDANRPPEAPLSLVHGDFQVSNMLTDTKTSEAVLVDWELAHIGDPREDLGWLTMVCNTIPPNILAADVDGFYEEYRRVTGWSKDVINPATSAYFLIISSIRTHIGMMKSSEVLSESPEQSQSVLAAYYMSIMSYQHTMWMQSVTVVETAKKEQS